MLPGVCGTVYVCLHVQAHSFTYGCLLLLILVVVAVVLLFLAVLLM